MTSNSDISEQQNGYVRYILSFASYQSKLQKEIQNEMDRRELEKSISSQGKSSWMDHSEIEDYKLNGTMRVKFDTDKLFVPVVVIIVFLLVLLIGAASYRP